MQQLAGVADALEAAARSELRDEDVPAERIRVSRRVHLRFDGTDTAVPVELADLDVMVASFEAAYRRTYSFLMDRPLIAEAVSVEAVGLTAQPEFAGAPHIPVHLGSTCKRLRSESDVLRNRGAGYPRVARRRDASSRTRAHASRVNPVEKNLNGPRLTCGVLT